MTHSSSDHFDQVVPARHLEAEPGGLAPVPSAEPTKAGGEAAPFLDIGCGNVPRKEGLSAWSRKQWVTRRSVLDRLNHWQADGYQCLWVTLTSSPSSPVDQLRRDFQTLRKRMARQLGYEDVQYVCVDTREGFGVLHIILAWKEGGS
jgi:hypothetical protein